MRLGPVSRLGGLGRRWLRSGAPAGCEAKASSSDPASEGPQALENLFSETTEMAWVLPPVLNPFRGYLTPLHILRAKLQLDKTLDLSQLQNGSQLAWLASADALYGLHMDRLEANCTSELFSRLSRRMSGVPAGSELFRVAASDLLWLTMIDFRLPERDGRPHIAAKFAFVALQGRTDKDGVGLDIISKYKGRLSVANLVLSRDAAEAGGDWRIADLNFFRPKGFFHTT